MLDETTMKISMRIQNLVKDTFHRFQSASGRGAWMNAIHRIAIRLTHNSVSWRRRQHCIDPLQLTFPKLIECYQVTLTLPETTHTSDSIKALAESKENDSIYG